eukprot:751626-Hanusia_phi.AAC.4
MSDLPDDAYKVRLDEEEAERNEDETRDETGDRERRVRVDQGEERMMEVEVGKAEEAARRRGLFYLLTCGSHPSASQSEAKRGVGGERRGRGLVS